MINRHAKKIPQRILVVKNRAMGDSIIGLSSISYIKSIFPQAKVTYAIASWIVPLYQEVDAPFDELYPIDFRKYKTWPQHLLNLWRKKFDLILELHQSGSSGKFLRLLSFFGRIPYQFHNHHWESGPILDQGKEKASIQKDLDGVFCGLKFEGLLEEENSAPANYLNLPPKLHARRKVGHPWRVVLGVVASKHTKLWPMEYFVDLMVELNRRYLATHPNLEFFIPLSPNAMDRQIGEKLQALGLPENAQMGIVALKNLPAEVSGSRWYIGNDTGLKHLAVALNIPTYTFFGPERPMEWHPYEISNNPYAFIDPLECRTQTYHYCPLSTCDSMVCLKNISVADVLKTVEVSFLK